MDRKPCGGCRWRYTSTSRHQHRRQHTSPKSKATNATANTTTISLPIAYSKRRSSYASFMWLGTNYLTAYCLPWKQLTSWFSWSWSLSWRLPFLINVQSPYIWPELSITHVMPPTSPSVNAAEQWNSLSSAAERRKVQNRISQRLHREHINLTSIIVIQSRGVWHNYTGKKMKARREEAEFASRHAETSSLESMKQIWRDTPSLDNSQKQIENTTQANSHTCSEMPSIVDIGDNQQSAFNQSITKYGLQLPLFQSALQDQTDQTPSLSYADFSLSPDPSTSFQELLMRREHVPQTRCPNCGVISEVNSLDGSHPKEKLKSKRDNNPDVLVRPSPFPLEFCTVWHFNWTSECDC